MILTRIGSYAGGCAAIAVNFEKENNDMAGLRMGDIFFDERNGVI